MFAAAFPDFLHSREFECESWIGHLSQEKKKKHNIKLRSSGAKNVADLSKQHIRLTICVWILTDSTTHVLTWPDGVISWLARSITETALSL